MTPDAARILSLVDLTSLDEDDTEQVIGALCERAITPIGAVAAVCVLPRWVGVAAERLAGTGVRIATVANFPDPEDDPDAAARETEAAMAEGADEVDVVAPWPAFLDGDEDAVTRLVRACADECDHLKVILETGQHPSDEATRRIATLALEAGASFLKTSTGKRGAGASLEAAGTLLSVASGRAGVKVAGGIRTRDDAAAYVALADRAAAASGGTGTLASPQTFRIGASSLLDELV